MPNPLYSRFAQLAKDKFTEFGKTIVYKRNTNSSYNPVTGVVSQTNTTHSVSALVTDYSDSRIASSGGLVQQGDRLVYIAAQDISFEPNQNTDFVTVDSEDWRIIASRKPIGEDIYHELQVRRV